MNVRRSGSTILLGALLVVAAVACGKKEEQPAVATKEAPPAAAPAAVPVSTPGLDPCALLTGADVQEVVGTAAENGKPNTTNPTVCDYAVGGTGILNVVWKKASPAEAEPAMAGLKERKIPISERPGLGDRSFFASPGYGMTQLNSYKGGDYVIITMMIQGAGEARQKELAGKLMEKALAKVK